MTAETRNDFGVWMHGVIAEADVAGLAAITGIAGSAVRVVAVDGMAAVVSDAPLAEYGEQALRQNLENLTWLERIARSHHAVVDMLAQNGTVVPARLATIHHDDSRVRQVLGERRDELTRALNRLAGREEWGVKAYVVSGMTRSPGEAAADSGRSGTAYLMRRKAQLAAEHHGHQAAADAAASIHDALAAYAVAARQHAPQDRRLSGASTAMVLNGAYLIDRFGRPGFSALAGDVAYRNPSIRLELTGPWPAYSFVEEGPPREAT
jgi:hypothetical protein